MKKIVWMMVFLGSSYGLTAMENEEEQGWGKWIADSPVGKFTSAALNGLGDALIDSNVFGGFSEDGEEESSGSQVYSETSSEDEEDADKKDVRRKLSFDDEEDEATEEEATDEDLATQVISILEKEGIQGLQKAFKDGSITDEVFDLNLDEMTFCSDCTVDLEPIYSKLGNYLDKKASSEPEIREIQKKFWLRGRRPLLIQRIKAVLPSSTTAIDPTKNTELVELITSYGFKKEVLTTPEMKDLFEEIGIKVVIDDSNNNNAFDPQEAIAYVHGVLQDKGVEALAQELEGGVLPNDFDYVGFFKAMIKATNKGELSEEIYDPKIFNVQITYNNTKCTLGNVLETLARTSKTANKVLFKFCERFDRSALINSLNRNLENEDYDAVIYTAKSRTNVLKTIDPFTELLKDGQCFGDLIENKVIKNKHLKVVKEMYGDAWDQFKEKRVAAKEELEKDLQALDDCLANEAITPEAAQILLERKDEATLDKFIENASQVFPAKLDTILAAGSSKDDINTALEWIAAFENAGIDFDGGKTVAQYKNELAAAGQKIDDDLQALDGCLKAQAITPEASQILVDRQGQDCLQEFIVQAKNDVPGILDAAVNASPAVKKDVDDALAWTNALEQGAIDFDGGKMSVAQYKTDLTAVLTALNNAPGKGSDDDHKKGSSWFSTKNLTIGGALATIVVTYLWYQNSQSDPDSHKEIKV